ncbi:unnamed protein product [Blepharisma stoltei]|uniref:Uncharacterized protein n=1 Tax=Blepharisma stoltei TaxID=1481888 RepID=A0AAU9IQB0_9CILI|nr:unnamed protein product [Blepharisma stoltei]
MWRALLFLSIGVFAVCPKYQCHTGGFNVGPTCAYPTATNDIMMQMCDASSQSRVCLVTPQITHNFTCQPFDNTRPIQLNYPGEFCHSNSQCLSGYCANNACQGQPLGGMCVSHADCNVGLFCNQAGHCIKQLGISNSCNSDWDCQNNLACNRTLYNPGLCLLYYSIANGDAVGMCVTELSEGVSNLCISGSCAQQKPNTNGEGFCQPSIKTVGKFPSKCVGDTDCVGQNTQNTKYTGTCACGMNPTGESYCNSWSGDEPNQIVQEIWVQHVNSVGIANCHTMRRFAPTCLYHTMPPAQIVNYTQNEMMSADLARYQNNDVCTQTIFNRDYYRVSPQSFTCKAYGCDTKNPWATETCLTYQEGSNKFAIKECENKLYCNTQETLGNEWMNSTCGPAPTVAPAYPGMQCKANSDCLSGKCIGGACRGAIQNDPCNDDYDCNPGLYCYALNMVFRCVPQIPIGQQGCATDYDCVTNAGCNATKEYPIGECVAYFSVQLGTEVPCPISGTNYLCESGSCYNNGKDDRGVCVPPPKSVNFGATCQTSNDCMGINSNNQSFVGQCQCGYNPWGYKYCNAFAGDPPGALFVKKVSPLYKLSQITMCHTALRFNTNCLDMVASMTGANANIYYSALLNFTNFPAYMENDECVRTVINSAFWSRLPPGPSPPPPPSPDNDDNSSAQVLIVLSSLALFI